jgi:dUTP pyrophosphatase
VKLKIHKVDKDLPTPRYAHSGDAGMDLYSAEEGLLEPGGFKLFSTGIKLAIPEGHEVQVRPRSGLASKHGISIVNAPGTVDHGYRGLIGVVLINLGKEAYEVKRGDRIAQMVLKKVEQADIIEVEELDETTRGENGYGSTGK